MRVLKWKVDKKILRSGDYKLNNHLYDDAYGGNYRAFNIPGINPDAFSVIADEYTFIEDFGQDSINYIKFSFCLRNNL